MSVIFKAGRRPHAEYAMLPNAAARDERLSFRARGILLMLASHADGFYLTTEDAARQGKEGVKAVRTAYQELEAAGYLRRVKTQDAQGRRVLHTYVYVYGDAPTVENRATENRGAEKVRSEMVSSIEDQGEKTKEEVLPPSSLSSPLVVGVVAESDSQPQREFPLCAREFVDPQDAEKWTATYESMHTVAVEAKPIESLMGYLHWCRQNRRTPTTEGAMRWFLKDQRDIRSAVTAERQTEPDPPKPWYEC